MSQEIRANIEQFLAAKNVNFSVSLVGAVQKKWDNDSKAHEMDQWKVSFSTGVGRDKKEFSTDYFTGIGHRQANKQGKFVMATGKYRKGTIAYEQWENMYVRPVKPFAADVLYSLVLDSQAANESFNDWCDNYGYSSDSIKAFNTYQTCCNTAQEMRKIFSYADMQALAEMLQDY